MNPEEAYILGLLVIFLGLFALHVYPGSTLITLAIMFIGVLAVVMVIKGLALVMCGCGINTLLAGIMFLVIIDLVFNGMNLVVYGIKVVLATAAGLLQILAAFITSLI